MTKSQTRFANILCDRNEKPFLLIVSDGDTTTTIPVKNTTLETTKRTANKLFGVKPANILWSVVLDGSHDSQNRE